MTDYWRLLLVIMTTRVHTRQMLGHIKGGAKMCLEAAQIFFTFVYKINYPQIIDVFVAFLKAYFIQIFAWSFVQHLNTFKYLFGQSKASKYIWIFVLIQFYIISYHIIYNLLITVLHSLVGFLKFNCLKPLFIILPYGKHSFPFPFTNCDPFWSVLSCLRRARILEYLNKMAYKYDFIFCLWPFLSQNIFRYSKGHFLSIRINSDIH